MHGERRLIFDVSSLARWSGPPSGIVRVEQELLRAWGSTVVPAVFDPDLGRYRTIAPAWRDRLLGDAAALVLSDGPALAPRGWRAWVPRPGHVVQALEGLRLTTRHAWIADACDRIVRLAARLRSHSMQIVAPDGQRFSYVPAALALGDPLDLHASDTILAAGYDWLRKSPAQIAALTRATGARYALTCYDLIPVLYPAFYDAREVTGFAQFWRDMLPLADVVLATSQRTRDDLAAWAAPQGLPSHHIAVVPLASSMGTTDSVAAATLPVGLTAGRFVLMVGTIEPRKGHRLLLDVWSELVRRGVPQATGSTLVFVGREGWKSDDVLRAIGAAEGPHLRHLADVNDATLERLYRDCAFVVLPSIYEGFGLPVLEAFCHGKAVLASNGGALPEVVRDLSPMLDPGDRAAWLTHLEAWMQDPAQRAPYEARIRATFVPVAWTDAAAAFRRAAGLEHTER
jgi:glycosyltransferase involved in cell wall biosynthesis